MSSFASSASAAGPFFSTRVTLAPVSAFWVENPGQPTSSPGLPINSVSTIAYTMSGFLR